MKKQFLGWAIVANGLVLASCQSAPKAEKEDTSPVAAAALVQKDTSTIEIPFIQAKNYFVKNTVKSLDSAKIETAEKFNSIFGMAATMNKEGKPTAIDFAKQYVIAVVLPETNLATSITPVRLQKDAEGQITLTYSVVSGEKQSFVVRPHFAIVVDKQETGNIILKEIKG